MLVYQRVSQLVSQCRSYSRQLLTPLGRIHDGKDGGVAFIKGGRGRVEDCKMWGNAKASVHVDHSGSQTVVKGCECANA